MAVVTAFRNDDAECFGFIFVKLLGGIMALG